MKSALLAQPAKKMTSMKTRIAEPPDKLSVIELARKFHQCTAYTAIPFDAETASDLFDSALGQNLVFVAEHGGEVVGFVLGLAFPSVLNKKVLMGSELAWWVEPEYRGTSAGIKLLNHIEQSAQTLGVKAWSMICLESLSPDMVEAIYLRMGYRKSERSYTKFF